MAINLKPVDVAVIGLGAAGGVAVLPLARAGLKVAGIEAGTSMDPRSFKPDEIHNNVRGLVTTGSKVKREIPTFRTNSTVQARQGATHPMMNAIGLHNIDLIMAITLLLVVAAATISSVLLYYDRKLHQRA